MIDVDAVRAEQQAATDELVTAVQDAQADQVDDLVSQVEAAAGDLTVLAAITATPIAASVLAGTLVAAVGQGAAQVAGELARQGLTAPDTDPSAQRDQAEAATAAERDAALHQAMFQVAADRLAQVSP